MPIQKWGNRRSVQTVRVLGLLALFAGGCAVVSEKESSSPGSGETVQAQKTAPLTPKPENNQEKSSVKVKVFNAEGQLVGPVESPRVVKTDAEWKAQLTPAEFQIARKQGTERPFCGTLLDNKKHGVYACICCGLPLFSSNSKFESGTGWPSFFTQIAPENVLTHEDMSYGMVRKEILCARCDCHLGHVFDDGPAPTNLRYCVNSESLRFVDESELKTLADPAAK